MQRWQPRSWFRGSPSSLLSIVGLLAAQGCGGAGTTPAKSSDGVGPERGMDAAADGSSAAREPTYCADSGCFDCGDSFCLLGWYCDLSLPAGPACLAPPECGGSTSCDCVEPSLAANCSCEERGDGVYVTCQ